METRDIDKLRKNIRELIKHRRKLALEPHSTSRFRTYVFRILPFILVAFIIFTIYHGMEVGFSDKGIIFMWTLNFTTLVGILGERHNLSTPPQAGKDEIEQWIWKKNLKSSIDLFFLLMGLTIIYSFIYTNPITHLIQADNKYLTQFE